MDDLCQQYASWEKWEMNYYEYILAGMLGWDITVEQY